MVCVWSVCGESTHLALERSALGAIAAHLAGTSSGHVARLDVAFKSDEAFLGWRARCRELLGGPRSEGEEAETYDLARLAERRAGAPPASREQRG